MDNSAEQPVASAEGETIGRRLRPRSPVKTLENQNIAVKAVSPSKSQIPIAQIEVDSSDPPSTSASECDALFSRMKKQILKSTKKGESAPVAPKVDEVFAVKPGGTIQRGIITLWVPSRLIEFSLFRKSPRFLFSGLKKERG